MQSALLKMLQQTVAEKLLVPIVVETQDTSIEGGHQAEQGGLSGLVDLLVSRFFQLVLAG